MTIYYINTGTSPNKGDGDTLRTAFNKINLNFQSLESLAASGVAVQTTAPTNPVTGQLWWNPNTDILAIYSNGGWIDTNTGSGSGAPTATQTTLGVVKGGNSILVLNNGSLESAVKTTSSHGISIITGAPDINGYYLRSWNLLPATTSTLGGVKSSPSILITADGVAQTRYLSTGTNGVTFSDAPYVDLANPGHILRTWSLVPATTATLGGVKYTQAGAITVNGDGTLNFAVMFDNGTGTQANMIWPNDGITPPSVTYDVLPATGGTLGGVKIGAGVNVDVDGTISVTTGAFALQTATNTILGGVKIGGGFSISPDGTISAQSPLVPIADTPPGGASDGELWWSSNATNLYIRYSGAWIDASPNSGGGGTYTLTTATHSALGGVKIGTGINIDGNGVISVTTASFALQTATTSTLGGVKVGAGLSVAGDGTISAIGTTGTQAVFIADYPPYPSYEGELWWDSNSNNLLINYSGIWIDATPATPPPSPYSLPTSTQSVLGGVKIDNITITIDGDGIISATGGGGGSTTWGLLLNKNNNNGPAEIALGQNAGSGQGSLAIAIGGTAGGVAQGTSAISIGSQAGASNQSRYAVAIGTAAGGVNQGEMATAVGHQAGASSQGVRATAIGIDAGFGSQGAGAVAIGDNAGGTSQGDYSVAIGTLAGSQNQGPNSIAIGNQAGHHSQAANSIVLNAGGFDLEGTNSGLYISPIRPDASTTATTWGLFYNPRTGEITTSTAATGGGGGGTYTLPVASTGTLGGVKIGEGIQQRIGGQIYIPTANTSTAGIVKLGNGFFESPAGTINVDIGTAIPIATTMTQGTIILGPEFIVTSDNKLHNRTSQVAGRGIQWITYAPGGNGINLRTWQVAAATTETFGGVVVGDNININTATYQISVPYASTTTAGVVKVYPGGPFVVEPDGMLDLAITFENGTGTQARVVWPDNGVTPPALHYDVLLGPSLLINPNGAIDSAFINTTSNGLSFTNSAPDGNGYRTRTWSLLPATTSTIGGVIADGTTINIDSSGTISVIGGVGATFTVTNVSYFTNDVEYLTSSTLNQYVNATIIQSDTAPASTTSTFWYDTVSGRTYTYFDGSWVDTNPNIAILPTASTSTLGVVKIGTGISIDNSGTISVVPATTATWATLADVNNANGPTSIAIGQYAQTPASYSVPNSFSGIIWDGTQFVTVGQDLSGNVMTATSSDGTTWTNHLTDIGPQIYLYNVVYNGSDQYVAVGGDDNVSPYPSVVLTSPDAVNWTRQSAGAIDNSYLNMVVWSGTQYVAVGGDNSAGSKALILTSPDGVVWTQQATDQYTSYLGSIAWSSVQSQFVSVGSDNSAGNKALILTSPDGIVWTKQAENIFGGGLYSVIWDSVYAQYVAVGQDNSSNLLITTSPDGVAWTQQAAGQFVNSAAFSVTADGGGNYVAVGYALDGYDLIIYSTNAGVTWTQTAQPLYQSELFSVACDTASDLFVAVSSIIVTSSGVNAWNIIAGPTPQYNVAIGVNAGNNFQGTETVAIGSQAGQTTQGYSAVAVGSRAGQTTQGQSAVAIGDSAGYYLQGPNAVAIGYAAGDNRQSADAVAIGVFAGYYLQGTDAVAMGYFAGGYFQGANAVAVGQQAGSDGQGNNAVAVGPLAGRNGQGANAVAIGVLAGSQNQAANTIIINATGSELNGVSAQTSSTYIAPIRNDVSATNNTLYYNTSTFELTWGAAPTNISYFTNDVNYLTSSTLNQDVNATIIESAVAPVPANTSTLWYDTVSVRSYVYYLGTGTGVWVDAAPEI